MFLNPGVAAMAAIVGPLSAEKLLAHSVWRPFQVVIFLSFLEFLVIFALPGSGSMSVYTVGYDMMSGLSKFLQIRDPDLETIQEEYV